MRAIYARLGSAGNTAAPSAVLPPKTSPDCATISTLRVKSLSRRIVGRFDSPDRFTFSQAAQRDFYRPVDFAYILEIVFETAGTCRSNHASGL